MKAVYVTSDEAFTNKKRSVSPKATQSTGPDKLV